MSATSQLALPMLPPLPGDESPGEFEIEVEEPSPPRVLLVDDDTWILRLAMASLQMAGLEVFTASDGESGLERAVALRPDLIISDLGMPRLDGWGFLRALRADRRTAEIPVILLSAHHGFREGVQRCGVGAQVVMQKTGRNLRELGRVARQSLLARESFQSTLAFTGRAAARLEDLGLRWTLRLLAREALPVQVTLASGGCRLTLRLEGEQLFQVEGTLDGVELSPRSTLLALALAQSGDLTVSPQEQPLESSLGHPESLLDEAAADATRALVGSSLSALLASSRLSWDRARLSLYASFGPPARRHLASLAPSLGRLDPLLLAERGQVSLEQAQAFLQDVAGRQLALAL